MEFDSYMACINYYVVAPAPNGLVTSKAFTRLERAEPYLKSLKNKEARIVRHSKLALSELPIPLLMAIVRSAGPYLVHGREAKVSQLRRDELVTVAYGRLSQATDYSSLMEGKSMPEAVAEKVRDVRGKKAKASAEEAPSRAKGKVAKEPKPKKEKAPDELAGKRIYLKGKENPRRQGTHGWKSMEVVRAKPGITYEDYLEAGGRRVDLKGSIELDQVDVK